MNDALNKLRDKMTKLEALFEDPRTPAHESHAAYERWVELGVKARKLELAARAA